MTDTDALLRGSPPVVLQAFPKPVDGPSLKAMRLRHGIEQQAIAKHLGITPKQVYVWEHDDDLDLVRSTRYQEALAALTTAKLAEARAS